MSEVPSMSIVHIISCPASGGAEVYVKDLSIAAVNRGHKVSVVFLDRAEEAGRQEDYQRKFLAELDEAGVKYDFIGAKARRNPFFGWLRTRHILRKLDPDVVHAHLYYGVLFSAWNGRPVVYTNHSVRVRFPRAVYRILLNNILAAYVGISTVCAAALRKKSCFPVVQINNGVDRARLALGLDAPSSEKGSFVFLAVGRLVKEKNYPRLLASLGRLPENLSWRLQIAGEGSERHALEEMSDRMGLSDRIEFLGAVTDVAKRMSEASAFVMSSDWEGLPIALIEATLMGLPVVVTNVGGCAEVVHAACNGIVVDEMSEEAFSDALRRMLEDSDLRRSFSRNALLYGSKYELSTALDQHLKLYSSVLN